MPVRRNPRRSCRSVPSSSFSDIEQLPSELHGRIFEGLPPSHRFLAPISRKFNAAYEAYADRNDRHGSTLLYGISTESQLELLGARRIPNWRSIPSHEYEDAGQLELLDGRSISMKDCYKAAKLGMLDFLKITRTRGIEMDGWDVDFCDSAAEGGHLDVLKWARGEGFNWNSGTNYSAAYGGHLDVLKWVFEKEGVMDDEGCDTCTGAAKGGHLEVLQWARAQGFPWDTGTCTWAAGGGHLHILQWARAHGCEWEEMTCAHAAKGGHLEVLQWTREQGCPWDKKTCEYAANRGHLDVLQWAREQGCPWDKETCENAANRGHLDVLQWAREQGCPWDKETCENAA
eukprot:CAMPEP_0113319100 /NCGR_PEP_ID=MMETSP0010_2-20120614/13433_1 /TAXON_ID=216773 ORGANISM="Corethron hystrix, Strain 308" /NCGR_SAMPLE_ID=MMETSP0010_2 /ASSEMBLY_ACC=CAM_ASM_000155 /LENGTH=343 /DNA_ID=CAMNT_0000176593 /DNA_START=335 /DNA_END=1363 /DNA_ORIENTATION=- /assembly_acc=CAM_ASM_000155